VRSVATSPPTRSLLDDVDDEALARAVSLFYDRMVDDERVSHYFDNVNMAKLRAHQRSFLVGALGDPGTLNGLTLQHAHYRLRLNDEEFDVTAGHLIRSLLDAGVPPPWEAEIRRRLERVRSYVVAPSDVAPAPSLRPR
jgi:hemoglobin